MNISWKMDQGKFLFTSGQKKSTVATAEQELIFNGCDYSQDLAVGKKGCLFFENDDISCRIDNKEDRQAGILCQTIRIKAKKEGILKSRYVAALSCSQKSGKVFVPQFWPYIGNAKRLKQIDTYYPHHTWAEGYKEGVRTPAICVWDKGCNVTVALLGPHPTHFVIEKCREGLRFVVCLDRPKIGPDGYDANPTLARGEELTTQIYWDICDGNWQNGMKRWMGYNMANIVKDDDIPPAWTNNVKMLWCKWDRINKRDIDEIADLGLEMVEVHPFTEPEPDIITYAHQKGLKILLEHMLLCYYEPVRIDHLNLQPGSDDLRIDKANLEMADKHPDWCALNEDGSRHICGYIYMCPNVEAFRQAKVKEAVEAIKKGYDGIRYDNALVLNCFSKKHKHTMTYAHAASKMLREIRQAVRQVNPEAIIFANNAGPDLYSVLDMHMYESGLSSESFLYEEAGKGKMKGSSYIGAHNRMMTAKVLWEFTGKRYCIHDFPVQLEKKETAFWRSCIFSVMHDGICSFGGGVEHIEGSRLPEYRIASALLKSIKEPLTEIINDKNIAYRLYAPGTILILETDGKKWSGMIKRLNLPVEMEQKYNLYSLSNQKVYHTAKGKDFRKGIRLEIAADGYDVLQLRKII